MRPVFKPDDDADRLGGFGLNDTLVSAVGIQLGAKADKNGIGHFDEAIVDAVDVTRIQALLAHVVQDSLFFQRQVDAAVAIGRAGNGALCAE